MRIVTRIVADKSLASNVVIVLKSVLIVRLAAPSPFNSLATPRVSEDLSARKRIGAKMRRAYNKGCSVSMAGPRGQPLILRVSHT